MKDITKDYEWQHKDGGISSAQIFIGEYRREGFSGGGSNSRPVKGDLEYIVSIEKYDGRDYAKQYSFKSEPEATKKFDALCNSTKKKMVQG